MLVEIISSHSLSLHVKKAMAASAACDTKARNGSVNPAYILLFRYCSILRNAT